MTRQQHRSLWSCIERKCLHLLQQHSSVSSLLQIHAFMLRNALETNINLLTKFIATCSFTALVTSSQFNIIKHARRVFDHGSVKRDAFLCNSMIRSHVVMRQFVEAFMLYRELKRDMGFEPDDFTFTALLKSCSLNLAFWEGEEVHGHILKTGFCSDLYVATALVDMYSKLGKIGCARRIFDEMKVINKVLCTALVVGYARSGDMMNARLVFDEISDKDSAAFNAMIDGYIELGDIVSARSLFDDMPEKNVISWTTMMFGYCQNGDVKSARLLFDAMPEKNLCSWNTMISGYCTNKEPSKGLQLFHQMLSTTTIHPDGVTIVSTLRAVADLGFLNLGIWIHEFVRRKKLDKAVNVCTSLIDMYAKCGDMKKARRVFDEMPEKGTASWNALINGLALNGSAKEALEVFSLMQQGNVKPNEITMIAVLCACNRGGFMEEGTRWFKKMKEHGIKPQIEHYGCMVDLLGRAGNLEEAEKLILNMPYHANEKILTSFLFACGYFNDSTRAERTLKEAIRMEQCNDGNYVLLRNLYASERRWKDMEEVKSFMLKKGAKKEVGCSIVDNDGNEKKNVSMEIASSHIFLL